MFKRYIGFFFVFLFAMSFLRCATMGSPEGGPRDSLPPKFLFSDPQPYSVDFKGKKVTLTFNEYVQLKDQQKLFFMSPPAVKKPLLTIKNKSVVVEFQEPLDSNATYRLDFGSSIVDNNEGNKMDNFSVVFSTGPIIDSLIMAGQVIDAYSRDTIIGGFIFYFDRKIDSLKLDSTMYKSRAESLFRSDSSGYFVADILKDKDYRIYALADENNNQLYESGVDKVGFMDTVFNPTTLPPFFMQYDDYKRRWKLDSLTAVFEVFKEDPPKKQTLLESKRPIRNQLTMAFNAKNTIIDTLKFDSLPDDWLIRRWNPTKDSLSIWIAPPTEEQFKALPDTIRGRVAFQKQDSLWNYYSHGQNVVFSHKIILSDKDQKKKEQQEKQIKRDKKKEKKIKKPKRVKRNRRSKQVVDSTMSVVSDSLAAAKALEQATPIDSVGKAGQGEKVDSVKEVNPFKVAVKASREFVPTQDMVFEFEFPLNEIHAERITLVNYPKAMKKGKLVSDENKVGVAVPYTFDQDSINILRYALKAKWQEDIEYELTIPSGVFRNIAYQTNDTLSSKFTVAPKAKFGTITLKTIADTAYRGCYTVQLLQRASKEDKIVKQLFVKNINETIKFPYLSPGKYKLRIIQDANCNKLWDTGDLVNRKHPEKVRVYRDKFDSNEILSKENWEVEVDIDYKTFFEK